jgi:hypothetical protein
MYTIESVSDGGPVVLALTDDRGRKVTPLEALQRELEQVCEIQQMNYSRSTYMHAKERAQAVCVHFMLLPQLVGPAQPTECTTSEPLLPTRVCVLRCPAVALS